MSEKNKHTKRNLAKACRMAANSIEKFGWVQRMYGSTNSGFCMAGAFQYAANSLTLQPVPEDISVSAFLACGGTRRELKELRKDGGVFTHGYLRGETDELSELSYGKLPEARVHIPSWNDSILTEDEGAERVTSFFRKLARHLEHGGHL